jgi:segregation and condensation protein B
MSRTNNHNLEPSEPATPPEDEQTDRDAESVEELDLFDLRAKAPSSDQPAEHPLPQIRNIAQAKATLEALLFAATEPLPVQKISALLNDLETKTIRGLLLELQIEYNRSERGMQIVEVAGGYQMATRPEFAPWVRLLHRSRKAHSISPASLETVAIVAYKQPITRAEVDAIRGVDSSAIIRGLVEAGLIEVVGQKQVLGRPSLYGTTKLFLKTFGLKRLSDLPTIEELKKAYKVE